MCDDDGTAGMCRFRNCWKLADRVRGNSVCAYACNYFKKRSNSIRVDFELLLFLKYNNGTRMRVRELILFLKPAITRRLALLVRTNNNLMII